MHREFEHLTFLHALHGVKKCLKVITCSSRYHSIYILLWAKLSFPNSVGSGLLTSVWTHAKLLQCHSGTSSASGMEKRAMKNKCAIESLRLAGTSGDHLAHPLAQSRVSWSRLPRTVSTWVFNTPTDGDLTIFLGYLGQFNDPRGKRKGFPMFRTSAHLERCTV